MNEPMAPNESAGQSGAKQLRQMQLVAGAMTAGVAIFALIAIVTTMDMAPDASVLTYVAVGFAVLMVVLRATVPSLIARQQTAQFMNSDVSPNDATTKSQLYGVYQTSMIVGMAMLEGAAFFCLIAYIVEGNVLPLTAAGGLLFLMLFSFPTHDRVEEWVNGQLQMKNF